MTTLGEDTLFLIWLLVDTDVQWVGVGHEDSIDIVGTGRCAGRKSTLDMMGGKNAGQRCYPTPNRQTLSYLIASPSRSPSSPANPQKSSPSDACSSPSRYPYRIRQN